MNDLSAKKRDASAARARLERSVSALKTSIEPEAIADTVADGAKDYLRRTTAQAIRTARDKPGRAAAAGLATLLFLLRKPIARALFTRGKKGD